MGPWLPARKGWRCQHWELFTWIQRVEINPKICANVDDVKLADICSDILRGYKYSYNHQWHHVNVFFLVNCQLFYDVYSRLLFYLTLISWIQKIEGCIDMKFKKNLDTDSLFHPNYRIKVKTHFKTCWPKSWITQNHLLHLLCSMVTQVPFCIYNITTKL